MAARLLALSLAAALLLSASPLTGQAVATSSATRARSDREVGNVAAFARLYGVIRYFYPSDAAAALDWDRFAVVGVARVRSARDARELASALRRLTAPLGPGIQVAPKLPAAPPARAFAEPLVAWRYLGPGFSSIGGPYRAKRTHRAELARADQKSVVPVQNVPDDAPEPGAHADLDLASGLKARVRLALTDGEARSHSSRAADLEALRAAVAVVPGANATPGVDARLADVVVAWSVFRHFYPYWSEAGVDWETRLRPHLEAAHAAATRAAQKDVLRALVADARDGHAGVRDSLDTEPRGNLPVALAAVEGRVVVVSSAAAEVPLGAVVTTIDGASADERLAREAALWSGTTQWRQTRAGWALATGPKGSEVRLEIDDGGQPRAVALRYASESAPLPRRPPAVGEVEPGFWYVDLTRAKPSDVDAKRPAIAAARGVIFDLRGYPTELGAAVLPHLLDAPDTDRWMHVARIVGPFYETAGWQDFGWDLRPAQPRIAGKVVFLTSGGAISYAESVMGYVADRKLGTIVGSTTAGTNGNVATFTTPGGFGIAFTGMRVTRHDGRSPHHLVGVQPDVVAAPTIAGLRAGRDEVLERGIAVAKGGP